MMHDNVAIFRNEDSSETKNTSDMEVETPPAWEPIPSSWTRKQKNARNAKNRRAKASRKKNRG